MEETFIPNPPLDAEDLALLAQLSIMDLELIDSVILSCVTLQWRKQALIVGLSMEKLESQHPGFSDAFFAERIRMLVESGLLQSQGNIAYMRFSEVRLPPEP